MSTELTKNNPIQARGYFQNKLKFTTGPGELNEQLENHADLVVVDVRDAEDFAKGHIPGAISLPSDQWDSPTELSKDKLNVLYCYTHVCHLAAKAGAVLAAQGYPAMEMDGGFAEWKAMDLKVEKGAPDQKRTKAMSA
jgi:rhodanese-related sulfurtransferase